MIGGDADRHHRAGDLPPPKRSKHNLCDRLFTEAHAGAKASRDQVMVPFVEGQRPRSPTPRSPVMPISTMWNSATESASVLP
jgi:hypothetical protein